MSKKKKDLKKQGKNKKNVIAVKSELVGIKKYLKTYNSVKYFLLYFSRFSMRAF